MRFRNVRAENWPIEQYHDQPWTSLSASRLTTLRDNPQAYFQQFVSCEIEKPDTDAMRTGRLFHEVVLEQPIQFDESNWHSSLGTFTQCRVPDGPPDLTGPYGEIWYRKHPLPGIVRRSATWGAVVGSVWDQVPVPEAKGPWTGFCAFEDMLQNGHGFTAIPADVLNKDGNRMGADWKAFAAEHEGQILLKSAEWRAMATMRRELKAHRIARELLFEGAGGTEFSIVAEDATYGVEVRTRIDKFRIHNGAVFVADIKTARDASPKFWSRAAISMKLYVQAYIMSRLAAEHFQMPVYYRYVVIDKKPPYRCEVFEVEPELIDIGEKQFDADLALFVRCRDSGIWRPPSHGKLVRIETPLWMQQDNAISWAPSPASDDMDADSDDVLDDSPLAVF